MTNDTIINLTIPFLKPSDNARLATELLIENKVTALPVVEDKHFLGYITESLLLDVAATKKISTLFPEKPNAFVDSQSHYFEALRFMHLHNTDIIAVLNRSEEFLGTITKADIATYFSKLGFTNAPGGILVLSVQNASYSIAEIGRIVESNDMKILCFYVENNTDDGFESFITLKLNKTDLTRLIASFERFGYQIEADFHESTFQSIDTERLDMLMRYLNV